MLHKVKVRLYKIHNGKLQQHLAMLKEVLMMPQYRWLGAQKRLASSAVALQ